MKEYIKNKFYIGFMGVTNDEIMVTPNGKNLFKLPFGLSWKVQIIQHAIAKISHKFTCK